MFLNQFTCSENTRRFNYAIDTMFSPGNRCGVTYRIHLCWVFVCVKRVVFNTNCSWKNSHDGVVLKQVSQCIVICNVIDGYNFNVIVFGHDSKYRSSDSAKPVNANTNFHDGSPNSARRFTISTTRFAYPQPLSYQETVFKSLPPITCVASPSKIAECVSPITSLETIGSFT